MACIDWYAEAEKASLCAPFQRALNCLKACTRFFVTNNWSPVFLRTRRWRGARPHFGCLEALSDAWSLGWIRKRSRSPAIEVEHPERSTAMGCPHQGPVLQYRVFVKLENPLAAIKRQPVSRVRPSPHVPSVSRIGGRRHWGNHRRRTSSDADPCRDSTSLRATSK